MRRRVDEGWPQAGGDSLHSREELTQLRLVAETQGCLQRVQEAKLHTLVADAEVFVGSEGQFRGGEGGLVIALRGSDGGEGRLVTARSLRVA